MPEVEAAPDMLGSRLQNVLEQGLLDRGIEATVETEAVRTTRLHRALVVSPQFAEMGHSERQEVVWDIVRQLLSPDEQLRISIILPVTPDEIEGKA